MNMKQRTIKVLDHCARLIKSFAWLHLTWALYACICLNQNNKKLPKTRSNKSFSFSPTVGHFFFPSIVFCLPESQWEMKQKSVLTFVHFDLFLYSLLPFYTGQVVRSSMKILPKILVENKSHMSFQNPDTKQWESEKKGDDERKEDRQVGGERETCTVCVSLTRGTKTKTTFQTNRRRRRECERSLRKTWNERKEWKSVRERATNFNTKIAMLSQSGVDL